MNARGLPGGPCGFTMVEVLVSMLVASIALAAVATTLRVTGRMTILARDGTTAVGLAQAKLEELLARHDARTDGEDTIRLLETAPTFVRTWRVELMPPRLEMHRLSATVQWDGGAHRMTLETLAWKQ